MIKRNSVVGGKKKKTKKASQKAVLEFYSRIGLARTVCDAPTPNYFYERVETYNTACGGV